MLLNKEKTRPIIIFSAEKTKLNKARNTSETLRCRELLVNMQIPFKQVIGSSNGNVENSFITHAQYLPDLKYLIYGLFEQESILYIDKQDEGKLLFDNKPDKKLGTLKPISIDYAIENYNSFTITGNKAWIIE